jgi:cytochrome b561
MLPVKNTTERFGIISQLLHWVITLLVLTNFYLIFFRAYLPEKDPLSLTYILLHKEFGVTILFLAIIFIIWRFFTVKPLYPNIMTSFERHASTLIQRLLLTLIVLMPIAGILMSYFGGRPTHVFNLFVIPALQTPNKFWSGLFFDVHVTIGVMILVALSIHVLAALRHHFWLRDNVLRRMLPVKLK